LPDQRSRQISKYFKPRPRLLIAVVAILLASPSLAEVRYVVQGVDETLTENILNHIDGLRFGQPRRVSDRALESAMDDAIEQARIAVRPYGYYSAEVEGYYQRHGEADVTIELRVKPGPPIIIRTMTVEVRGAGSGRQELVAWRDAWPLREGQQLDQVVWEERKEAGLYAARSVGFLAATFAERSLELDLENNTAEARLVLDTGERFVMGSVDFGNHVLAPGVVENLARFDSGDPYSTRLIDDFRLDLWQSGYFTDVEVRETLVPDSVPPRVDLAVDLATESRNFYQGALGYGSDTGIRVQANYRRQPMSSRGDRLDLGIGWQQFDEELRLVGVYRLPRRHKRREFWMTEATLNFENQDLEFKRDDSDEDFIRIANGDIEERHIRFGRLKVHNLREGLKQLFVTPFVQYLNSEKRFTLVEPFVATQGPPEFERLLTGTDSAISLGIDIDSVEVIGKRFDTRGVRERAWVFTGQSLSSSAGDFTQVYVATRRSYRFGERYKLLLRGEIGYTDARVDALSIDTSTGPLELSATRLPNFYRFRAGGSASVRGYGFEQLSNNNIGSNNIITASSEIEIRFLPSWSAAVFADIGNAFNDWEDTDLKLGLGVGIRWYSIAGPIRIDFARAMDFDGKPWRLHFTLGTPLL
jgi:translocation and assembly module TamA